MTRRHAFRLFFLSLLGLFAFSTGLAAQDAASRIRDRLPEIDALKAAGVVGENNTGLLESRSELAPAQETLMEAENADRLELYRLVGRRSGQSVEDVGRQRAVRIAQIARSGVWIQNARGEWAKKP